MVLWEITLATAYFLGLKRTYRLALRMQRRLISAKHPKIRQFAQRRTRAVSDVVLKIHQNIQQRDIDVKRNLSNWMLRCLDRIKPSAQIRASPLKLPYSYNSNMDMRKRLTNFSVLKTVRSFKTSNNQEGNGHLFTSAKNMWHKSFPTISMALRPQRPSGIATTQYRNFSILVPEMARPNYKFGTVGFEGVIRKDIMQYILKK